jgi:hypothetical protein
MEFFMPIWVAQQIVLRLQEALAKWNLADMDDENVIQFSHRDH